LANLVLFNDSWVKTSLRTLDDPRIVGIRFMAVGPDYWDTLRIPLITGRAFTTRDGPHASKVAVLNRGLADRLFPHQNPLGKRILIARATQQHQPEDEIEIVGVAQDTKLTNLSLPAPEVVCVPLLQISSGSRGVVLEVRSAMDPPAVAALAAARIANARLSLTVQSATALNDEVDASLADDYIRMQASSLFGALALVLIAFGLYGLMAYTVAQRTREIGIRTAVGAGTSAIVGLVLRQSLRLVAVGIAVGVPGAVAAVRALSGMVFGLPPVDVVSLAAGTALLGIAGLIASFLPAWRAAHLDPVRALRIE
jgi:hypothetical protein